MHIKQRATVLTEKILSVKGNTIRLCLLKLKKYIQRKYNARKKLENQYQKVLLFCCSESQRLKVHYLNQVCRTSRFENQVKLSLSVVAGQANLKDRISNGRLIS